ncbi:MAG: hypothetical protein WD851_14945 [Pirellulales bacterium]
MTTVRCLRRFTRGWSLVAGKMLWAKLACLTISLPLMAQNPPMHWLHAGAMPPGAIGSQRLLRGGPLSGYFQPVEIRAPQGTRIDHVVEGHFAENEPGNRLIALMIGGVYRFRVAHIPNYDGVEVYPTIELIDRLYPPCGKELRFPVPIELTDEELGMAARGMLVTRVIYVEDPMSALPVAQRRDEQSWYEAAPTADPLVEADALGRPIAILRIGGRYPQSELAGESFTYWSPPVMDYTQYQREQEAYEAARLDGVSDADESTIRDGAIQPLSYTCDCQPAISGCTTGYCGPPCGFVGPPDEYICDGGDFGLPANVRKDWKVVGLEQEDAIVHYDLLDGRVIVKPSNRVCIYAPRFAAVRKVTAVLAHERRLATEALIDDASPALADKPIEPTTALQQHSPAIHLADRPPSLFRVRQQAGGIEQLQGVAEVKGMIKSYCNLQIIKLGLFDNSEKPWLAKSILAAHTWTGDQAVQILVNNKRAAAAVGVVTPGDIFGLADKCPCLRLVKLASTDSAHPGDTVEFTLRYDNIGSEVIGNVTILDSLSARLEYIPETAKSSVDAAFSFEPNEAGSQTLRWEIKEPTQAGTGGILQFKARVR